MDDKQFDDLKQFVAGTVSQLEARLDDRFEQIDARFEQVDAQFRQMEKTMQDGFAAVAAATDTTNDRLDDHEGRISSLEQQAA